MRYLELYLTDTFVTFVSRKSLSASAQALHVTEAAVSQHLKKIQAYFDFPLFERHGHRRTLTARGEVIYAKSVQLLKVAEDLRRIAQSTARRRLRIAVDGYVANCRCYYWDLLTILPSHVGHVCTVERDAVSGLLERQEIDAYIGCDIDTPPSSVGIGDLRYAWYGDLELMNMPRIPVAFNVSKLALSLRCEMVLREQNLSYTRYCESDDYGLITELVSLGHCVALLPLTSVIRKAEKYRLDAIRWNVSHQIYMSVAQGMTALFPVPGQSMGEVSLSMAHATDSHAPR